LFGTNVPDLYLGRFLAGLSGGGAFVLVPLYVAEIAEDRYVFFFINKNFSFTLNLISEYEVH